MTANSTNTVVSMELVAGVPTIVGTWHKDFQLKWGAGNFSARTVANGRRELWCCADANGTRFGQTYETLEEVLAAITGYDEQDVEDQTWSWYVGAEWRSEELLGLPDAQDGHDSVLLTNEAGPGTAKEAAYKIYNKICKEYGCGMVWIGKINPSLPEDDDGRFMEQETAEIDPQQLEDDNQASYEDYLERNHVELAWQDGYEAWKREF